MGNQALVFVLTHLSFLLPSMLIHWSLLHLPFFFPSLEVKVLTLHIALKNALWLCSEKKHFFRCVFTQSSEHFHAQPLPSMWSSEITLALLFVQRIKSGWAVCKARASAAVLAFWLLLLRFCRIRWTLAIKPSRSEIPSVSDSLDSSTNSGSTVIKLQAEYLGG